MAILGTGDIGKIIKDREGFTFFAAGESNRFKLTAERKRRELFKIAQSPRGGMFVYFSTLSIYYSNSHYTRHKKEMEAIVKSWFKNYCIFRIGNITFGDNPNTLWNKSKQKDFVAQDVNRYLVDADEINHWLSMIPPRGKHEMNVTGRMINVKEFMQ